MQASLEALERLPGVSAEFVVEALRAGWTAEQAASAWMERQQAEIQGFRAARERASVGVEGLGVGNLRQSSQSAHDDSTYDDPVEEYSSRVRAKIEQGMEPRRARAAVAKANPELHTAYIIASQNDSSSRRMAEARAEDLRDMGIL